MPTLISRGAANGKSFGLTSSSLSLVTTTFTSNTTWVAPFGTNLLLSMSGYGGAATSDSYTTSLIAGSSAALAQSGSGYSNPPYAQWANLYNYLSSITSVISANAGLNKLTISTLNYYIAIDDSWFSQNIGNDVWVDGSSYTISPFNSPPTSGNVLNSQGSRGWNVIVNGYNLGDVGAATTGVGKTFPGGTLTGSEPFRTAVAPVTTTFTDVAVTPGGSYPIVVPAGGSLTIQYYA